MRTKKVLATILAAATLTGVAAAVSPAALKSRAKAPAFPDAETVVRGVMTYSDTWNGSTNEAGIYTIEAKPGGKITCEYKSAGMANTVAALVKDGVMYAVEQDMSTFGIYYRTYKTEDWSAVGSRQEIDDVNEPSDLTYDPVTNKVYGGFWSDSYGGFSNFGSFNLTTAEATFIDKTQRDERDFIAIAATPTGTIYALHGWKVRIIDPSTGGTTDVGWHELDYEVNPSWSMMSSMVYDEVNDRLLAVVSTNAGTRSNVKHSSALYSIDPHSFYQKDGSAIKYCVCEKLMDLPGNATVVGLHIVERALSATAPGAPQNLTVQFDTPTALTGKVRFTAPTLSAGGVALTGTLLAQISVNGEVLATLDGIAPGAEVASEALTFPAGESTVKVILATATERGGSASIDIYAGEDTPASVTDVVLDINEQLQPVLTWKAPTVGANGGKIDPTNLRYTVVRVQDSKKVAEGISATTFTDTDMNTALKTVSYTVAVSNAAGTAPAVESNKCLAAGAMTVPYSEGFDTKDDFDLWTIINTNAASTWKWHSSTSSTKPEDFYAYYEYAGDKTKADNWLISPAIRLEEGKAYKLTYSYKANNKSYPESFEVHFGKSASVEGMGTPVAQHLKFATTSWSTNSVTLQPETTGAYFVGFHAVSDPWMYQFYVDNITVEEIDTRVPAVIEDLTVTPAGEGALKATISFTTPTKNNQDGTIDALTEARIYRVGTEEPIKIFTGIAPGEKLSYEDSGISASGLVSYTATTSNAVGESVPASAQAFVGVDVPGAPTNVHISEKDGHPYITWDAPAKGANGGWFDASAVTYRIVRSDGEVLAEAVKGTTFTDSSISAPRNGQIAYWYLVTPYVGTAKGSYAQTELLLMGTPYAAPLTETFANADMAYSPWIYQSDNAVNYAWTLDEMGYNPSVADQNGDRGLATFHSVGEPEGTESWFMSPKVNISALENPVLSFWMYQSATPGEGLLKVYVAPGTDTFEATGFETKREAENDGWSRFTVDLSPYSSAEWIRIAFVGIGDTVEDIYVDNVSFESQAGVNAALNSFRLPSRIAAGEDIHAQVSVTNTGLESLTDVTVTIADNKGAKLAETSIATLEANKMATASLVIAGLPEGTHALTATLAAKGDSDESDNSLTSTMKVVAPVLQTVTGLEATQANGDVTLTWNAPSHKGAVTDDFESYADFIIDGVGDWTMWDGDFDVTYMISNGVDYPNSTARKAFQVINAQKLGINQWSQGMPHSANKMMAALCSFTYVNNDWLISPELNGKEQWISFWAKSFTHQNISPERMRFYYSSTDNEPSSFTELTSGYVELPDTWTEYRYYLPEGAKHFAIACVSDGSFAMFVDDATFNDLTVPAWTLSGYDIYCNGEKIGTTTETSFVHTDVEDGNYTYTVRPVFAEGEGLESEAVKIALTGIDGVYGSSERVNVFNAQGILLRENVPVNEAVTSLTPGMYIIGTTKVYVK